MVLDDIELLGGNSAVFRQYLAESDPCFGRYAKTAPECVQCRCPVLVDGAILLLREVCMQSSPVSTTQETGVEAKPLFSIRSAEVLRRLRTGESWYQLWLLVLNGADAEIMGSKARDLLAARHWHLTKEKGEMLDSVPYTKALLTHHNGED